MELAIIKLIYDYSLKGKLADKEFIDKLIEIVVSKKELHDYVHDVEFTDKLEKNNDGVTCAIYEPLSGDMLIDYESVKILMEKESSFDYLFLAFEQNLYRNIMIAQLVLHELEHAMQNKQVNVNTDCSTETQLIRTCFEIPLALKNLNLIKELVNGQIETQDFMSYLTFRKELNKKYYIFDPSEKLAQVNSYQTIVNAIELIRIHIPNLYEFLCATLVEEMLKGYYDSWNYGICPTQVYLSGIFKNRTWFNMDFYDEDPDQLMKKVRDKYSLSKRLSLGLPILFEEYDANSNWLHGTNKYSG